MSSLYSIWDEKHCEIHGDFDSLADAMQELRQRAGIPWDQPPNRAPCRNWRKCGRDYVIRIADPASESPVRIHALTITSAGVVWAENLPAGESEQGATE